MGARAQWPPLPLKGRNNLATVSALAKDTIDELLVGISSYQPFNVERQARKL